MQTGYLYASTTPPITPPLPPDAAVLAKSLATAAAALIGVVNYAAVPTILPTDPTIFNIAPEQDTPAPRHSALPHFFMPAGHLLLQQTGPFPT